MSGCLQQTQELMQGTAGVEPLDIEKTIYRSILHGKDTRVAEMPMIDIGQCVQTSCQYLRNLKVFEKGQGYRSCDDDMDDIECSSFFQICARYLQDVVNMGRTDRSIDPIDDKTPGD